MNYDKKIKLLVFKSQRNQNNLNFKQRLLRWIDRNKKPKSQYDILNKNNNKMFIKILSNVLCVCEHFFLFIQ